MIKIGNKRCRLENKLEIFEFSAEVDDYAEVTLEVTDADAEVNDNYFIDSDNESIEIDSKTKKVTVTKKTGQAFLKFRFKSSEEGTYKLFIHNGTTAKRVAIIHFTVEDLQYLPEDIGDELEPLPEDENIYDELEYLPEDEANFETIFENESSSELSTDISAKNKLEVLKKELEKAQEELEIKKWKHQILFQSKKLLLKK